LLQQFGHPLMFRRLPRNVFVTRDILSNIFHGPGRFVQNEKFFYKTTYKTYHKRNLGILELIVPARLNSPARLISWEIIVHDKIYWWNVKNLGALSSQKIHETFLAVSGQSAFNCGVVKKKSHLKPTPKIRNKRKGSYTVR
jgi:hypothetical protein